VLCANDDTRRIGRGSPGTRLSMRRDASFANLRTIPINGLKIDGSSMRRLKDDEVDRATVASQRAAFDGFDRTATGGAAPAWRAHGGWEDG
jgi:hypothetical protein